MARKDTLQRMRNLLKARRDTLRRALAGDLSALKQQSGGDEVDWAIDSAQDELNSQLAEVESRELARIEDALQRMHDGTYGACDHCGRKIPVTRLQAVPYATFCINCQRQMEQNPERHAGDARWDRVEDPRFDDVEATLADIEAEVG